MHKRNYKMPSPKRTRTEYILTDKLFCGQCGAPMIGDAGTFQTGGKSSYYVCEKRQHGECSKSPVRQELIEKTVLEYTISRLQDNELLEYIADKIFAYCQTPIMQTEEREALEKQLADVETSMSNLARAAEMGITNVATKARMDELEQQKVSLTAAIAETVPPHGFKLTRDQILYFLKKYRDADMTDPDCQKRLIQTFINEIFLCDDGRCKVVYNYTGDGNTATLNTVESVMAEGARLSDDKSQ